MEELLHDLGCIFLQKKVVALGSAVIGGATLWSPAASASKEDAAHMRDYTAIEGFTPAICQAVHEDHAGWIEEVTCDPEISPPIVLTHHPPIDHPKLHHRCYTLSSAPLFHANLSALFSRDDFIPPKFWGFGHTHIRKATKVGSTLFMANALGSEGLTDRLWELPSLEVPLF
jgi:hypothetical protein